MQTLADPIENLVRIYGYCRQQLKAWPLAKTGALVFFNPSMDKTIFTL